MFLTVVSVRLKLSSPGVANAFQPQASFVSPRMSRDTAAVMHERRAHRAGDMSHREMTPVFFWRRLPETLPAVVRRNFAGVMAATGSVAWGCGSSCSDAGRRRC